MGKFTIDILVLSKIVKLLKREGLSEIEVGEGDSYIRIINTVGAPAATPLKAQSPEVSPSLQTAKEAATTNAVDTAQDHDGVVRSVIVGTAYLSPNPGAKPFVTVGDKVEKGDTVVIIEAMKIMNAIVAVKSGVVKKILVTNGQPVEFDQPLVVIE